MTFQTYTELFEHILHASDHQVPYNDKEYFDYTKLNWSRMNRWLKKGVLLPQVQEKIKQISEPQNWILITEPWCGDAAHIVPFIKMLADLNPLIHLNLELRDAEPFRIQNYLTNGGKAIPKLVIQNVAGEDLAVWGPRPAGCEDLFREMKQNQMPFEEVKIHLQNWYNERCGVDIQKEIAALL
ncbi:thioredoxin family protein [Fluviicola sp.]|jgi:hypothetical protein|uniref:thioredoxin family protein n=1 Tax=Fluviicola sp. TaxID=1917219 RepID=UPI0028280DEC|nr:thioredoxin family protein [Fluviicola sp.]MDR0801394.1 thioredoxin family protein [Fluviicola sp.]